MLLSEVSDADAAVRAWLDRQVYDAQGRRLSRVCDVELEREGEGYRIAAVHVGPAALARRLGARRLARRLDPGRIAWANLRPALGHPGALQLRDGRDPPARVHRHRRRAPA
jgi:hypothetical protein